MATLTLNNLTEVQVNCLVKYAKSGEFIDAVNILLEVENIPTINLISVNQLTLDTDDPDYIINFKKE